MKGLLVLIAFATFFSAASAQTNCHPCWANRAGCGSYFLQDCQNSAPYAYYRKTSFTTWVAKCSDGTFFYNANCGYVISGITACRVSCSSVAKRGILTGEPYSEESTGPYGESTVPYSEESTVPYSEGSTVPYSEGSTVPYSEESTGTYGEESTGPYGEETTARYDEFCTGEACFDEKPLDCNFKKHALEAYKDCWNGVGECSIVSEEFEYLNLTMTYHHYLKTYTNQLVPQQFANLYFLLLDQEYSDKLHLPARLLVPVSPFSQYLVLYPSSSPQGWVGLPDVGAQGEPVILRNWADMLNGVYFINPWNYPGLVIRTFGPDVAQLNEGFFVYINSRPDPEIYPNNLLVGVKISEYNKMVLDHERLGGSAYVTLVKQIPWDDRLHQRISETDVVY